MSLETQKLQWSRIDSFAGNTSSEALTTHRVCPICDGADSRPLFSLDDFQMYSDSAAEPKRLDIRYVQCLRCWAMFLNPVLTELGFKVLFAEAEQSYGSSAGRADEQIGWLRARSLIDSSSVVLDIGCYDGDFLSHLPTDVAKIGVDIDATAIERGRRALEGQNAELIVGDFETFPMDRQPDTIVMYHVLEHLARPRAVLAKLRSLAHAQTRLVVEVPIVENGATNDVVGFFSVHHMTSFSRRSLRNCLSAAGWHPVEWLEQDDYNGCRVLAAPADATSDLQGDPTDLDTALETLASWDLAARDVSSRLGAIESDRCLLWGGGTHTEILYQRTTLFQADLGREFAIVDSDARKQGQTWRGIPVLSPTVLGEVEWEAGIPLVISSYGSQDSIHANAIELGVPQSAIIELYDHVSIC